MDQQTRRINASPTKEFFIDMLTRDILLSRAILDLVDNCIDGARNSRQDGDYGGLWVKIELDQSHFRITDNCGGIPVSTARDYAFRFGRPVDVLPTHKSIGQFGVGMKRAFFKLGRRITVVSTTASSHFTVEIDVNKWMDEATDEWHFEFSELQEGLSNALDTQIGTDITVTELGDSVSNSFGLASFIDDLRKAISVAYSLIMERGVQILVNGVLVTYEPQSLFASDQLKPASVERAFEVGALNGKVDSRVIVRLQVGISERKYQDGGWYIYCNDRLVLRADKTASTVWGESHNMPQYSATFAWLRGYAYFESDNPALLPWTTTKYGVDEDSPLYRNTQLSMVELTKPVIAFMRQLEDETTKANSGEITVSSLAQAVGEAKAERTDLLAPSTEFVAPKPPPPPPGPKMKRIQYSKPAVEVDRVMDALGVTTNVAVGEKTFEYFMKYEVED